MTTAMPDPLDADASVEARFRRALAAVAAVGAATRLVILAFKWHKQLILNDSFYYSVQAAELAKGHGFVQPFTNQPGAEHGPLTTVLMAAVSWSHDVVPWQRCVTVACGIVTILLIGIVAKMIAGPSVGVIAAALAVVYPNLWMNDGLVMSESVSVLVVMLWLLSMIRFMRAPSPGRAAFVGAMVGLGALARSELIVLLPLVVVFAWIVMRGDPRRLMSTAMVAVVTILTLTPWIAYNMSRFEKPVTLSTNDGTTLVGAYCDEVFHGWQLGGWSLTCVTAASPDPSVVDPSAVSSYRRSVALHYLRDHLAQMPKVEVARVARTLDLFGLRNLVFQDVGEERWRWASWAGIVSFWLLAPMAFFGVRRLPGRERWLLILPCLCVLATTLAFYGAHRIRSSMEPTIVIGAAVTLARLPLGRRFGLRRSSGVADGIDRSTGAQVGTR